MLGRLEEAFEAEAQESAPDKENNSEAPVGMVTFSKLCVRENSFTNW